MHESSIVNTLRIYLPLQTLYEKNICMKYAYTYKEFTYIYKVHYIYMRSTCIHTHTHTEFQLCKMKWVLEIDCTTIWMYLTLLKGILKVTKMVLCCHNLKFKNHNKYILKYVFCGKWVLKIIAKICENILTKKRVNDRPWIHINIIN